MSAGTYISLIGHMGLIGWALIGTAGRIADAPIEPVTAVSVISAEAFDIMTQNSQPIVGATPAAAQPNVDVTNTPTVTPPADTPPTPNAATPTTQPPAADETPTEIPLPLPRPFVPPLDAPVPEVPNVDVAETSPLEPAAELQNVDRVAPQAAAPPPDDVAIGDTPQVATQPADEPTLDTEVVDETQAPEAATEEIVTEPNQTDAPTAPLASLRPQVRPRDIVAESAPDVIEQPVVDPVTAALEQALAEAANFTDEPALGGEGPPSLTPAEVEGLRFAIQQCWNVGSLSSLALSTTVVVRFDMTPDARPDVNSIELVGQSGGDNASARQAFEAARRAIIRCGTEGYGLPSELYEVWQSIEMTFNPERMRIK